MKRRGCQKGFSIGFYWTPVVKVWFWSVCASNWRPLAPEMLTAEEREQAVAEMEVHCSISEAGRQCDGLIRQSSPHRRRVRRTVFFTALTTKTISTGIYRPRLLHANSAERLTAPAGALHRWALLAAVAAHKLGGVIPVGAIFLKLR